MLRFEKQATIKSIYNFGDSVIFTISYYLDKEYCEHQMEFTNDEIIEDSDFPEFVTIGHKFDIEIQIFTDSKEREIVTIRKI